MSNKSNSTSKLKLPERFDIYSTGDNDHICYTGFKNISVRTYSYNRRTGTIDKNIWEVDKDHTDVFGNKTSTKFEYKGGEPTTEEIRLNRKEFIDNVRVIDGVFNKIDIKLPIWMKLKQSGMYDTELYLTFEERFRIPKHVKKYMIREIHRRLEVNNCQNYFEEMDTYTSGFGKSKVLSSIKFKLKYTDEILELVKCNWRDKYFYFEFNNLNNEKWNKIICEKTNLTFNELQQDFHSEKLFINSEVK